jgi:ParB/RepB/Spo0J family partition protein
MTTAAAAVTPSKPSVPPPAITPKNGAATAAPPKFVASQLLELALIEPDPHNPRKDFPKEQMNALISSVMLLGVRQPIEVRQLPGGKYRIVAGERRWRAAKAVDLKEIPAIVRTLTDLEAADVQLAENLQREDLSPLEIAGGYKRQLELGRTMDQVCERAGKKRSAVYAMVQLLQLGDAGRKALGEEKISASVAQLVARVPKALQEQALSVVEGGQWQRPLTFKQAEAELGKLFIVDLKKAPWELKDEGIPCVAKSCAVCPKRSGNAVDLFPDVKNPDACTDQVAYRQKLYAHAKAGVEKAGLKLLKPDDAPAEKLFYNGGRGPLQNESGYVDPGERCYDDTQSRSYKELLTPEQRKKLTLVALDVDGKQRQLYERAGLMREVKKAGLLKARKAGKPTTGTSTRSSPPQEYKPPAPDVSELADQAVIAKVVEAVEKKGLTPAIIKELAVAAMRHTEWLLRRRGLDDKNVYSFNEKDFDKSFGKTTPGKVAGILYEALVLDPAFVDGGGGILTDIASEHGVDAKKTRATVERANLVAWSTSGKTTTGKGASGVKYTIKEEKAAGPIAKKWKAKVWFDLEYSSRTGAASGVDSGGHGPIQTLELAKEEALKHEEYVSKKGAGK